MDFVPMEGRPKPKSGYRCKTCGTEGGRPDSHWYQLCPNKETRLEEKAFSPPKKGYVCKFCHQSGGEPESHWFQQCPKRTEFEGVQVPHPLKLKAANVQATRDPVQSSNMPPNPLLMMQQQQQQYLHFLQMQQTLQAQNPGMMMGMPPLGMQNNVNLQYPQNMYMQMPTPSQQNQKPGNNFLHHTPSANKLETSEDLMKVIAERTQMLDLNEPENETENTQIQK